MADPAPGKQLGFFSEEGHDFSVVVVDGTPILLPQVANGRIHFGMANPKPLVISQAKGIGLPVRFVYNLQGSTANELVVRQDSPIRAIADLKGRKLGIGALTWGNASMGRAILKEHGLEWGKDVEIITIGTGPAAWRQLSSGGVDATWLFFAEDERMARSGVSIRRVARPAKDVQFPASAVLASEDTIKRRPAMVAGHGRAIAKSTVACAAAPEACARSYWEFDPSTRPAADKEEDWVKATVPVALSLQPSLTYTPERSPQLWGRFPDPLWRNYADYLTKADLIPAGSLDPEKLSTGAFVAEFNRFDPEAVRARAHARAFKAI